MADPSLQPILERLNSTAKYHPFTADTFTDWASEAGDRVTVSRDNNTYVSPVHKQTLSWHGRQQVAMETSGNKEREAIERLSERKYRSGGGGAMRSASGKIYTFEVNDTHFLYELDDEENGLMGRMEITESAAQTLFQKTGVNDLGQNETLTGRITQTASSLTSDYIRRDSAQNTELRGVITQTASSLTSDYTRRDSAQNTELRGVISQTAESLTSDYTRRDSAQDTELRGVISQTAGSLQTEYTSLNRTTNETMSTKFEQTAEQIALKVSKGDVLTQLSIDANNVSVSGGNLVVDGYVKSTGLDSAIATLSNVTVKRLTLSSNGYISLPIDNGSVNITGAVASDFIRNLKIEFNSTTNQYTLSKTTLGNSQWTAVGSFSRATTLSAVWSGDNTVDNATFTVSASPQGKSESTKIVVKQSKAACWVQLSGAAGGKADGTIIARIDNPQYANGWGAAYGKFSSPTTTPSTVPTYMSVSYAPNTVDGNAVTRNYYVTTDNNYAYIKYNSAGSTGVVVAQTTNSAFYNGIAAVGLQDMYWNSVTSLTTSRTIYAKTSGKVNSSGTDTNVTKNKTLYLFADSSWTIPAGTTAATASSSVRNYYIGDGANSASYAVAQNYISMQKSAITATSPTRYGTTIPSTDASLDSFGITTRESAWYTFTVSACGLTKSYRFSIGTTDIPSGSGGSHSPSISTFNINQTGSTAGKTYLKAISRAAISARTYIFIDVACGGKTSQFYVTVND